MLFFVLMCGLPIFHFFLVYLNCSLQMISFTTVYCAILCDMLYCVTTLPILFIQQDQLNEWANMTGFLCALGSVCLQNRAHRARLVHYVLYDTEQYNMRPRINVYVHAWLRMINCYTAFHRIPTTPLSCPWWVQLGQSLFITLVIQVD